MRINQFIARSGKASRRGAEELIKSGHVYLNDKKVENLATEVNPVKDEVKINGEILKLPKLKYIMLNKPKGFTTTKKDKFAEKTIFELLPKDESLFSVGRLDKETEGLILITNDGDFGQNIIHPKNKIEKEYLINTQKPITENQIKALIEGVLLEDGPAKAKNVVQTLPTEISIVITEGRNRQVRRMISAVDNNVVKLKRIRIGNIKLDIKEGHFRELSNEEIKNYV